MRSARAGVSVLPLQTTEARRRRTRRPPARCRAITCPSAEVLGEGLARVRDVGLAVDRDVRRVVDRVDRADADQRRRLTGRRAGRGRPPVAAARSLAPAAAVAASVGPPGRAGAANGSRPLPVTTVAAASAARPASRGRGRRSARSTRARRRRYGAARRVSSRQPPEKSRKYAAAREHDGPTTTAAMTSSGFGRPGASRGLLGGCLGDGRAGRRRTGFWSDIGRLSYWAVVGEALTVSRRRGGRLVGAAGDGRSLSRRPGGSCREVTGRARCRDADDRRRAGAGRVPPCSVQLDDRSRAATRLSPSTLLRNRSSVEVGALDGRSPTRDLLEHGLPVAGRRRPAAGSARRGRRPAGTRAATSTSRRPARSRTACRISAGIAGLSGICTPDVARAWPPAAGSSLCLRPCSCGDLGAQAAVRLLLGRPPGSAGRRRLALLRRDQQEPAGQQSTTTTSDRGPQRPTSGCGSCQLPAFARIGSVSALAVTATVEVNCTTGWCSGRGAGGLRV